MAVYGWNLAIALVTGNSTIWKPSPTTPLCSIAITRLVQPVLEKNGISGAAAALVCGDVDVGKALVGSRDVDMGESFFDGSNHQRKGILAKGQLQGPTGKDEREIWERTGDQMHEKRRKGGGVGGGLELMSF